MKLFGFEIRRAQQQIQQAKAAPKAAEKSITNGYSNVYYGGQQSKLITALGGSSSTLEILGDPRSKIITFMAMVAAFPEVARTLRIHELIMGSPEIESEDKGFEEEANAMLREWVWREALDYEGNRKTGMNAFAGMLAKKTMVEGQSFYEILDAQGMPVLNSRQKIDSTKLHDSQNFAYVQYAPNAYRLDYQNGVKVEMDKRITAAFNTVVIENASCYPWGMGLLYNAATMALKAAIMEENQLQVYKGKGSSPRITLFGLKPQESSDANILSADDQRDREAEYATKVGALETKYSQAIANANNYGVPIDLTSAIIGDIRVQTHSHADSISSISSYPEDIKLALSRLVVAMNGEPAMVGLPSAGDGQGGNRTEIQMQSMSAYGKGLRKHLEPHLNRLFLAQSARLGMRLPKYGWEWEGLDTTDIAALAAIEKQKADTVKVQVDTIVALTQAGEISAATNLAKEMGWDWFTGSEAIFE